MSSARYNEYKDSGVEWLGEVPGHWRVAQGRRLFCQKREPVQPNDDQLSATQKYGVIPQRLFMELEDQKLTLALSGLDNFKHVEENDFVISLRSFQGGIERSLYAGCVSPAYTVLRATEPVDSRYWAFLMKSTDYIAALQTVTDSIREGKSISYEQFGQIRLPVPPISEQHTIAAFLDRETTKIDALVEEQEKLIALLKEKRQAVISHAVTKGLDPSVPMKDSGIEWLGEVPGHWNMVPLKTVISTIESGTSVNAIDTPALRGELGVLKVSCVYNGRFDASENKTVLPQEVERVSCPPRAGCLVVSRANTSDLVGAAGLVQEDYEGLFLSDLLWQVHCTQVEAAFVHYWTLTRAYRWQVHLACTGSSSTMQKITKAKFRQFVFFKPPLVEQKAMVTFLNTETDKLDRLVNEAERAVDLLKERRSALISEVVTGKIDVRELVAEEVTA